MGPYCLGSFSASLYLSHFLAPNSPLNIRISQGSILLYLVHPFPPRQVYALPCICLLPKARWFLSQFSTSDLFIPLTTITSVPLGPCSLLAVPAAPDSSQSLESDRFLLAPGTLHSCCSLSLKCVCSLFTKLLLTPPSGLGLNIIISWISFGPLLHPFYDLVTSCIFPVFFVCIWKQQLHPTSFQEERGPVWLCLALTGACAYLWNKITVAKGILGADVESG